LSAAITITVRWRAFPVVAVFCGLRASELRGLRWPDVDLNAGRLSVTQRADAWRRLGPPKSAAGLRDIPLTPMAVNGLRQWKTTCPTGELDLVFPNGAGKIESHPNIVKRVWDPLQVKCGLTVEKRIDDKTVIGARYGFHSLRHAAASLFIAHLGWTPKRVQTVMGHSSITITFDLYGHLFEDHDSDREAMKKLQAAVAAA
jgi:integrase